MSRSSNLALTNAAAASGAMVKESQDFLTIHIGKQIFGLPILQVRDVLGEQKVTRIPLGRPEIAGVLNLRGRIVTAIDIRKCLNQPSRDHGTRTMSVVIDHENELYSFIIDQVGDVMTLTDESYENVPATLDPVWAHLAKGIYRLDGQLLIILDIEKLLSQLARPN